MRIPAGHLDVARRVDLAELHAELAHLALDLEALRFSRRRDRKGAQHAIGEPEVQPRTFGGLQENVEVAAAVLNHVRLQRSCLRALDTNAERARQLAREIGKGNVGVDAHGRAAPQRLEPVVGDHVQRAHELAARNELDLGDLSFEDAAAPYAGTDR